MLFPDSICFWTSAEYQVVNISAPYERYVDGIFEDCAEEVLSLQDLIQPETSQMMKNKDMHWTEIWALLLPQSS